MSSPIFSNLNDYIWKRYDNMCERLVDHLKDKYRVTDDFFETVEEFALQQLTKEAYVELAHHRELLKKSCGFGDCKYLPCCVRGLN